MYLGLDVGYGYTKGINNQNKRVLFPSVVARGFERTIDPFLKEDSDIIKNLYVKITTDDSSSSGYYYIGELAQRSSPFSVFDLNAHRVEVTETKILMAVASALLTNENSTEFKVVTGLPLKQYKVQKDAFVNQIKNFEAVVEFPDYNIKKTVKFTNINVFPQAAGAVYTALTMENLYDYFIKTTYVVLVDIGFKTTDFATFYYNGKLDFIPDLSNTIDIGISRVLNFIDRIYTQKTGANADLETLMTIIKEGRVYYRRKFIDFTEELNELKKETFQAIMKAVLNTLGDKYERISTVFVAGGGTVDLFMHLKDAHYKLITIPDPQFANAKGFLKVAQSM
ncbi:StbA family protein [Thermoanaerobacter mathranii]|uniref:ParM/StbA family protein n=1 Tax=Thermoanaerobacter mathranii TaxID=583357 RepID=UPI003D6B0473